MKKRLKTIGLIVLLVIVFIGWRLSREWRERSRGEELIPSRSQVSEVPRVSLPAERILEGYADETSSEPIEDLRKIHRLASVYFSVIKDSSRYPIGGNADFSAALRGENPNKEIFLSADHPVFEKDSKLLIDRWGEPLVIHPEGWRSLEIRSAGPDRKAYTEDDLILLPTGLQPEKRR